MKYYLMTTGAVFGLISLAHFVRGYLEGAHIFKDPIFDLLTLLAIALCVWAFVALKQLSRTRP